MFKTFCLDVSLISVRKPGWSWWNSHKIGNDVDSSALLSAHIKGFLYLTQHPTKRGRTYFKTRHDAKMLLPSHSVLHENRGCKCVMQKKKWHTDINVDHRLVKLQCALKSPPQQWIQCMHGYEVRKYHFIWCCQSYMFGIASWTSSACQNSISVHVDSNHECRSCPYRKASILALTFELGIPIPWITHDMITTNPKTGVKHLLFFFSISKS